MKEVLEAIAKSLVDNKDEVVVTEEINNDVIVLNLKVAQSDMGKVIGKSGRVAKAIRQVLNAAASRDKLKVIVDIG
ncbi:MAG: KH domain-containing protein [Clostridiales bacterium]|nr:KH domain-containing protein [Clostridiales bacterium]MDO5140284.1 KH domain-containing protein [Eubacteriales bacterium]